MPNFANPLQGNVNRKLTKEELIQAIRLETPANWKLFMCMTHNVIATDTLWPKK
jgi:hypothetical protein